MHDVILNLILQLKMMSIELPIPDAMQAQFPPKINSKLRAWMAVDLEQYNALVVTQHLREGDAVTSSDFFFRLQVRMSLSHTESHNFKRYAAKMPINFFSGWSFVYSDWIFNASQF